MSKLHDPTLPPGAIVKAFDDGGALRNDGVRLKPANQNPWYVLATLHGEQPEGVFWLDHDTNLADRNREAWNGWAKEELDNEKEAELLGLFRARRGNNSAELPDPSEDYDFSNTHFLRFTCFEGFSFENRTIFTQAAFIGDAKVERATFKESIWVNGATFKVDARFKGAKFCDEASFDGAEFCNEASFKGAEFSKEASFNAATFSRNALFNGAKFGGNAHFIAATFSEYIEFNSAAFEASTSFGRARFLTHVPEFHATEFYEDTVFPIPNTPTDNWPPQSGEGVMPADAQKRAYSRLRLFFAKTQQIDEEQFFHRQEMRCKRAMAGWATKGMYSIYSALSDYGISIWRPLAYLTLLTVLGGDLLGAHRQALGERQDWAMLGENMGWSLANLVPFTGFGRTFFGPDFYQSLPGWLQAFAGAQTLAAIPLLFLLGLGLRNTFRLR